MIVTRQAIEAAKAAYWTEAHNGGGYSDKCYEAALTAALSFLSPIAAPDGWQPEAGLKWSFDRIREEISAGRKQNALAYLSFAFAEITRRQDWQPIETAPRDGTKILAWSGFWDKHHLVRWNQGENAWCEGSWCFGSVPDMVWMPLPAPPAAGDKP